MTERDKVCQALAAARAGSQDAIGEALQACQAYLLLVANREIDPALRAKGGASDLVQETFMEAQRDFHHFKGTTESELLAWLRQVLLNNLSNFSRRYRETAKRDVKREVKLEAGRSSLNWRDALSDDAATPSRNVVKRELEGSLDAAMARLPEDYRQVLIYRYREEKSFEEIGNLMARSSNAARKLWSRAVEHLQKTLDEET